MLLLAGPTASGKSALALAWAASRGGEIICADATTVYRGMDIGSAKPSRAERAAVPHHCLDLAPCSERFDVVRFATAAREAVDGIIARGRTPVVCGGSGFYLKSFLAPIADTVEVPESLAAGVDAIEREQGLPGLVTALLADDPDAALHVDLLNPRRVSAALRRVRASGKSLGRLLADFESMPPPYPGLDIVVCAVRRDRADLRHRIAARTRAMIAAGLVDEVRRLRDEGLERNPPAALAIGYRETLDWLRSGSSDLEALATAITTNTCQLVRKQETWIRHQLPVARWIDIREDQPLAELLPHLD